MSKIQEKLKNIQANLVCQKKQYNSFGKYHYRNLEDIFEGLKKLLDSENCIIQTSDEIVIVGERYYTKATATLTCCETGESIINTAYAREDESKKGMDSAQVTGTSSSYARKYAMNGLFAIDDVKDADNRDNSVKGKFEPPKKQGTTKSEVKAEPKNAKVSTTVNDRMMEWTDNDKKRGEDIQKKILEIVSQDSFLYERKIREFTSFTDVKTGKEIKWATSLKQLSSLQIKSLEKKVNLEYKKFKGDE